MFTDSKAIDFFTDDMLLVKVNGDEDTLTKKEFHVSAYPTTVLLDQQGKDIDRIIGFLPTEEYIQTLVDYSNGIGTLFDLLRRAETEEDRELYFEIANKYKYRGGVEDARTWFERVITIGEPTDSLSGRSRMGIADMYRRAGDYDRALVAFQEMADEFQDTEFEEIADIYTAVVYNQANDTANAIEAFKTFIEKYPESEDVEYAREKIENLENPPETAE